VEKLEAVMAKLVAEENLDVKHRDHKLVGSFKDRRECHIEPDWLLIYKIEGDKIIFERTGSHSDLFK
jgi:mRNA interferase YafQ